MIETRKMYSIKSVVSQVIFRRKAISTPIECACYQSVSSNVKVERAGTLALSRFVDSDYYVDLAQFVARAG